MKMENIIRHEHTFGKVKRTRKFTKYFVTICKNLNSNLKISDEACQAMNLLLIHFVKKITLTSCNVVNVTKKKTLGEQHFETSLKLFFKEDIANMLTENVNYKMNKYLDINFEENNRQQHAGLIFPPCICEKIIRDINNERYILTKHVSVYCSIVVERLSFLILKECNFSNLLICVEDLRNIKSVMIADILKKIKFNFKDDLLYPKKVFEKYIRKNIKEIKISKNVFIILQKEMEEYIDNLLINSYNLCKHASRTRLTKNDIVLYEECL